MDKIHKMLKNDVVELAQLLGVEVPSSWSREKILGAVKKHLSKSNLDNVTKGNLLKAARTMGLELYSNKSKEKLADMVKAQIVAGEYGPRYSPPEPETVEPVEEETPEAPSIVDGAKNAAAGVIDSFKTTVDGPGPKKSGDREKRSYFWPVVIGLVGLFVLAVFVSALLLAGPTQETLEGQKAVIDAQQGTIEAQATLMAAVVEDPTATPVPTSKLTEEPVPTPTSIKIVSSVESPGSTATIKSTEILPTEAVEAKATASNVQKLIAPDGEAPEVSELFTKAGIFRPEELVAEGEAPEPWKAMNGSEGPWWHPSGTTLTELDGVALTASGSFNLVPGGIAVVDWVYQPWTGVSEIGDVEVPWTFSPYDFLVWNWASNDGTPAYEGMAWWEKSYELPDVQGANVSYLNDNGEKYCYQEDSDPETQMVYYLVEECSAVTSFQFYRSVPVHVEFYNKDVQVTTSWDSGPYNRENLEEALVALYLPQALAVPPEDAILLNPGDPIPPEAYPPPAP